MEIAGYGDITPLGSGASSDLYRGRLPASGRWVAIKVFRFALADDAAERRYLRDCELAKAISMHPHIATLYDAGLTEDRQPYLTMELVDGGSAADRLALTSHGRFTPAEVGRIGIAVAGALQAAHDAGVVHRFLQPSGILLTNDSKPLVTELGIALFAERWEAAGYLEDMVPYHASPEVLEREVPAPASDVYSLASTLYTMLTGAPPHQAEGVDSVSSLLLRVLQQEPPSLADRGDPAALDTVIRAGLAAELGERIPTAAAFRQQLEEILEDLEELEDDEELEEDPGGSGATSAALPAGTWPSAEDRASDPTDPASSPTGALEHVGGADADTLDNSRRWRRRALIVAGASATILLALAAEGLRSSDGDTPSAPGGGETGAREAPPLGGADRSTAPPGAGTDETPDLPDGGTVPPGQLVVPTGLTAHGSEAGVQLDWDESDTDSYAVLVLSEISPPRVETTTDGPSLFIPAIDLRTDDGYCFAVARLDMVAGAATEAPSTSGDDAGDLTDEVGPAFSSVVCIRGAAEDTIRTE